MDTQGGTSLALRPQPFVRLSSARGSRLAPMTCWSQGPGSHVVRSCGWLAGRELAL